MINYPPGKNCPVKFVFATAAATASVPCFLRRVKNSPCNILWLQRRLRVASMNAPQYMFDIYCLCAADAQPVSDSYASCFRHQHVIITSHRQSAVFCVTCECFYLFLVRLVGIYIGIKVNPLMGTLKPNISGPLCSNTVFSTLTVDGWVVTFVTFGTARRGLGSAPAPARPGPSSLYQM